MSIYTGTAGWSIPPLLKSSFPEPGTHLERYARVFNCAEINSSFYNDHKPQTYEKWARSVPGDFRFSVKLSGEFTREHKLRESGPRLREVLGHFAGLGEMLGVVLVQLPPSLQFEAKVAVKFASSLRKCFKGEVAWEPRHISWVSPEAISFFEDFGFHKVLADPERALTPRSQRPRVEKLRYLRLHGSPQIYKSNYEPEVLARIAKSILHPVSPAAQTWCIFDNTTYYHATQNALDLRGLLKPSAPRPYVQDSLA